jgi:hypothetical protein
MISNLFTKHKVIYYVMFIILRLIISYQIKLDDRKKI